jgi:hypothetical protein
MFKIHLFANDENIDKKLIKGVFSLCTGRRHKPISKCFYQYISFKPIPDFFEHYL